MGRGDSGGRCRERWVEVSDGNDAVAQREAVVDGQERVLAAGDERDDVEGRHGGRTSPRARGGGGNRRGQACIVGGDVEFKGV